MQLKEKLQNRELITLDGAMGTMLEASYNLSLGRPPEEVNILSPKTVTAVHEAYLKAGSDIILTNTFGASSAKLNKFGLDIKQVIPAAVKAAKAASDRYDACVALDIGPLGQLLEPMGTLCFEDAYDLFKEQVILGVSSGVDLIYIETMSDLYEMRAALLAAKENSNLPVFATMSFDTHGRTFSGCDAASVAITLTALGADAIGVNCSLGPKEILPILNQISAHTHLPLIAKPNAGLPKIAGEKTVFDIKADEFAHDMTAFAQMGVCIVGGCCGTDPEFISLTKKQAQDAYVKRINPTAKSSVCSGSKTVFIDNVAVIGERINPTGKKALKQALINNDMGYILKQAAEQINAGADILDINVGIPDIDQRQTITRIIKAVQGITNTPLQIDSNDPEVIEAALRVYNGKAIVNSVTGEAHSLNTILPIIKKYGGAVVGLTLDEKGIPITSQERFDIAKKIIASAAKYGIPKQDVYIDCLALTISADGTSAIKTLQAIEKVSAKLGVKTLLGVSNISFGLPERKNINNTFLSMALKSGLNMPIVNPNAEGVMEIIYSYKALMGLDENCKNYISKFAGTANDKPSASVIKQDESLEYLILNGIKDGVEAQVQKLLDTTDGLKIIDEYLIPVLDKVGFMYESGKIFLPQLISSSEAAKAAFDYLNKNIDKSGSQNDKNKQIILATVKGDVHDIGKNIVKVVLQNYGFEVIDLGYDTDIDLIVSTALNTGAKLVGLSALMTTTLKSMEQTITALYNGGYKGEVMVGGAVLDEDYAKKIKATYYAKNAQVAANIARGSLAKNI